MQKEQNIKSMACEVKGIERVNGAQRKILVRSSEPGNKAQRKVEYKILTMSRNYEEKLLQEIITENYELVYQSSGKCEIYRDTGISKREVEKRDFKN